MERAHGAGVIDHPPSLIYDGKMISGINAVDCFHRLAISSEILREDRGDGPHKVPQIVIKPYTRTRPIKINNSWYHPVYIKWIMDHILELLESNEFRKVGSPDTPGTILLLSPYKEAVKEYASAIKALDGKRPELQASERVEARTWDVSQGHEADIVGIDYVRGVPTGFMDGMHRFNVGLTRARQGEWHVIAPPMVNHKRFYETEYVSKMYLACANGSEGSVAIAYDLDDDSAPPRRR